ncbi:non-homologous end-joining factor 1 isoform X2 [Varanus komodoensis]|uniref:non-homologous end-joining factor 1 isoform X2 n=1 Tax=Varanus komodoensis TaxID=61221 RepID=UPI001CF7732E|nr:non-homologous end-joining factor 1 isoform X2 [Varanus komodoensis]
MCTVTYLHRKKAPLLLPFSLKEKRKGSSVENSFQSRLGAAAATGLFPAPPESPPASLRWPRVSCCRTRNSWMECTEDADSRLLQQPWASVCFAESTTLMAKAWFGNTSYTLLLSDLSNVWYESADAEMIQQRSKKLNKRLTAHVSSFLNHLRSLICPLLEGKKNSSTCFSCQLSPSTLTLRVKSELSGLPFYWDFHCLAAPVELNVLRQNLSRKKLSSRHLRLRLLQVVNRFLTTVVLPQTLPQACCLGDGHLFTSNLKELYMAVTREQARVACKRHREASGDSGTHEHPVSQDLAKGAVDLPTEEERTESQADTMALPSQTQKTQLPVAKVKRKKAKGLFD